MYVMKLGSLMRVKLLAFALVSVAVVGGATAVFAATPTGQSVVRTFAGSAHATATHEADNNDNDDSDNGSHANDGDNNDNNDNNDRNNCPGHPDAQRLATEFSLSTGSKSDAIQAICSLHQGAFKGTTPNGTSVTSSRVFGYGEIDMLLTYAQFLATQDKTNASGKLTSDNARSYLAKAVQNCGATPLNTCLKTNIPGFQPGNGHDNDNENGNHDGNGNGNDGGKPTSTPTPHH